MWLIYFFDCWVDLLFDLLVNVGLYGVRVDFLFKYMWINENHVGNLPGNTWT